jgi:hypothetical protein
MSQRKPQGFGKTAVILYDKLAHVEDATLCDKLLVTAGFNTIHVDIREPHVKAHIAVHIRMPLYSAVPWAHKNILLMAKEDWNPVWKEYLHTFSIYSIRDEPWLDVEFNDVYKEFKTIIMHKEPMSLDMLGTPVLELDKCPPISIITPTYNRKNLIDIAFHNLLSTDYPQEKIEWIVVEDNEEKEKMATEKIVNFQAVAPKIVIKYIPIEGRLTIGQKRNIGVKEATYSIILFMDDDDHYPVTSFRRRVAWLSKGDIVCCSTLPLYDLKQGTSAISVPPFNLGLSQRISEATLTFRKEMWEEREFSNVSIAEGELWIKGREDKVVEISPQQIIVAFTHGNNQSARVVPSMNSSCFWGFPKEYLTFIHGLVGVQVE